MTYNENYKKFKKIRGETQEGYMYVGHNVGGAPHDEGRDTCLFHRIDFPNQTSFSLQQSFSESSN